MTATTTLLYSNVNAPKTTLTLFTLKGFNWQENVTRLSVRYIETKTYPSHSSTLLNVFLLQYQPPSTPSYHSTATLIPLPATARGDGRTWENKKNHQVIIFKEIPHSFSPSPSPSPPILCTMDHHSPHTSSPLHPCHKLADRPNRTTTSHVISPSIHPHPVSTMLTHIIVSHTTLLFRTNQPDKTVLSLPWEKCNSPDLQIYTRHFSLCPLHPSLTLRQIHLHTSYTQI